MLRVARIIGIGMNADRTRSGWKAAAVLAAGIALSTAGIVYAAAASDDDQASLAREKVQAEDVPDPVTQALKAAVRNGSMSEARAIQVYSLLTDGPPGSNREAKTEAYLDQTAAELDAMVSAGKLSAEDAEAKLIALENQVASKEEFALKMASGDRSESEVYLDQAAAKLDALVMKGELSAEDAEAKMIALEKQIAVKEEFASRMEIADKSKTEAYLELVAAELDALVKSGELSAEDAEDDRDRELSQGRRPARLAGRPHRPESGQARRPHSRPAGRDPRHRARGDRRLPQNLTQGPAGAHRAGRAGQIRDRRIAGRRADRAVRVGPQAPRPRQAAK